MTRYSDISSTAKLPTQTPKDEAMSHSLACRLLHHELQTWPALLSSPPDPYTLATEDSPPGSALDSWVTASKAQAEFFWVYFQGDMEPLTEQNRLVLDYCFASPFLGRSVWSAHPQQAAGEPKYYMNQWLGVAPPIQESLRCFSNTREELWLVVASGRKAIWWDPNGYGYSSCSKRNSQTQSQSTLQKASYHFVFHLIFHDFQ